MPASLEEHPGSFPVGPGAASTTSMTLLRPRLLHAQPVATPSKVFIRLHLSLLLTYVKICGTLPRVTSTNSPL